MQKNHWTGPRLGDIELSPKNTNSLEPFSVAIKQGKEDEDQSKRREVSPSTVNKESYPNNQPQNRQEQTITAISSAELGVTKRMPRTRTLQSTDDVKTPVIRLLEAVGELKVEEAERIIANDMNNDPNLVNSYDINDERQKNALIIACRTPGKNQFRMIEMLLRHGAFIKSKTTTGASVIFLAAGCGSSKEVLQLLLDSGGKVDYPSFRGQTALFAAAEDGHTGCVEWLLDNKAAINAINLKGETAAMRAAENNHIECLRLLRDRGADLNLRDHMGWDALYMAKEQKHKEIIELLLDENYANHAIDTGPPSYPIDPDYLKDKLWTYEEDVDEMKIQTMFKMVDECRVSTQGKDVLKKVLYLTNKQAVMFTEDAMERAVQALDIGEPKFVIKLVDSSGLAAQMKIAHAERAGTAESVYAKSTYNTSEISVADERIIETQVLLFMKSCILPLAMQTNALILVCGSNDCYLSTALARVAVAEQARLGSKCPFTVLATASEMDVHAKAVSPDSKDRMSIAQQIARASPSWGKRITFMNKFYSEKFLPHDMKLSQCDLTDAAERYIIFESFEEGQDEDELGTFNEAPRKLFESTFLQYMTRRLPSIAIQSFYPDHGISFLVDLVNRNIPVLLLDTRERAFTLEKYDPNYVPLTELAKATEAFPMMTTEQVNKIKVVDGNLINEGRQILLNIAMEMVERQYEVMIQKGVVDNMLTSMVTFFHSVLSIGNEIGDSELSGVVRLFERVREMEKLERTNKDAKSVGVPPEMASKVMDFIYRKIAALDKIAQLAKVDEFLDNCKRSHRYMLADAIQLKTKLQAEVEDIERNGGYLSNYEIDAKEWLAYYDILTNQNTYSGSIFDLDEVKRILGSVAKIDRLPTSNSLEALRVLQDAWDHVEIYHQAARSYKLVSKVTYLLLLASGIAVTSLAMVQAVLGYDEQLLIMSIAFAASFVGSYVSFVNPAIKWQQLRMAALSIESNIWTFRTRAGPYRTSNERYDNYAERYLADVMREVKEKILEGADIKSSAFYSTIYSTNDHNQHPPSQPTFGAIDNFTRLVQLEKEETERRRRVNDSREAANNDGMLGVLYRGFLSCWRTLLCRTISNKDMAPDPFHISIAVQNSSDIPVGVQMKVPLKSVDRPPVKKAITKRILVQTGDDKGEDGDEEEGRDQFPVADTEAQLMSLPGVPIGARRRNNGDIPLSEVLAKLRRETDEFDGKASIDSHYEPVQPDSYIRFRVLPAINFYKARIPRCHRTRMISQFLLVLGSLGIAIFSMIGLAVWTSIISIVTASITAYLEFSGTNSKISRYSFTVHSLQGLLYWWQTLPIIDRSVVSNIDRLVLTCEDLLHREQQAWRSTSQAIRMLQKQTQPDSAGNMKDVDE